MSSPNQNSSEMKAWLAKANAAQFVPNDDFGSFGADTDDFGQENPSSQGVTGAGRNVSSDGSLDSSN
jgi:hypothetical protein